MTMAEVHEITEIAMKVNGFGSRRAEFTGDLPTVFFNMTGTVAYLTVQIFEHGWDGSGHEQSVMYIFHLDEPLDVSNFLDYKTYMDKLQDRCIQQGGTA